METITNRTGDNDPKKPLHFLIISDSPEFRADVRQMLGYTSGGTCKMSEAETAHQGISLALKLAPHLPDCVLLDYDLTELSALEVLSALRGESDLPPFPVVVLGSDKRVDGRALIRAGAQDYAGKSWLTSTSLMLAVENAVARFALISENRRMHAKLRENEARLAALLEQLPVGIGLADSNGKWVVSNSMLKGFVGEGLPSRDARHLAQWRPHDGSADCLGSKDWPVEQALAGAAVRGVDLFHVADSGAGNWIRVSSIPFRNEATEVTGAICVMENVDAQKRAQEVLAEQASLLDLAHDAILVRNSKDQITFWNKGAEQTYGWTREEALGRVTHELLKTRAIPLPEIEAAIRKHGSWEGELVHTRKDGVEIVVSSRWVEKLNLAKELVQVMEINRDITDRKKSELELHESHQALQNRQLELTALMDAVPAQVWISRDRECIHMIGNKAVYDLVGLPAGSNVSESAPIGESPKNFQTYRGGKPVPREELPMQQAARTGNAVRGIDLELRFADGSSKWIYGNAVPLRDAEGTLCGAVAGMIDFTEYKNAFDRLADREHKLRVVFDGITTCLALLTPEGRLLETNRVTLESSNCRREDLLGQLYWNTVWFQSDPGASTLIKEAVQRAAGGEFVNIQAPIVTPAGNKEPFQISFRPILVEHGKVELIVSEARLPSI